MNSFELSNKAKDITGNSYGRLEVVRVVGKEKHGSILWECLCECGNLMITRTSSLTSGHTKSCGCLRKDNASSSNRERMTTHGMSSSGEYYSWLSMKARVLNMNHDQYKDYGGRGIKVCDRWLESFENFYEDMGDRPEGMTLDRIDNDGDYSPDNCRWVDRKTQCRNRRYNLFLSYEGVTKTLMEWSEDTGVKYDTLLYRLKRGYTDEQCLFGLS